MQLVRVAAATLNQTPLDWVGNQRRLRAVLARARAERVTVLCLPELCLTGYGCEDAFLSQSVHRTAAELLDELVSETQGLVTCFGLPIAVGRSLFNACALAVDGKLVGLVPKQILAGDGIHYEPRWFSAWSSGERTELDWAGQKLPLGDWVFDVGGVRLGFEICEDAWAAERPGVSLAQRGVDIILNPSASHFAFGKHATRRRLVLEASRAFQVSYLYANLLGNEAGRVIYDGDALVSSPEGLLDSTARFSFEEYGLATGTVDITLLRSRAAARQSSRTRPLVDGIFSLGFEWPKQELARLSLPASAVPAPAHQKEEEFTRAVCLGLFDTMRKSRARGFVVSSSGGADSTTVACLVGIMVALARRELGPERFAERLGHCSALATLLEPTEAGERAVVEALLTTVYQATRNSSSITRDAARAVASALGSRHFEFDVEPLVAAYRGLTEKALGRELSWDTDDLALQNIQARVRAPSVWMLANINRALLLATSNRSEAAVGYATMDGDTAGGLSPIAGIDKAFIRHYLRWLRDLGPVGFGPLPAVDVVCVQAPTAELRPAAAAQTDEDDLMPYDVLDAIERAAIRDKYSPVEVFELLRVRFGEATREQLGLWVERFFRLWAQNQWKRERYAPSFHLDDANLDPKTWCRFPILSGGFERELAELREWLRSSAEML